MNLHIATLGTDHMHALYYSVQSLTANRAGRREDLEEVYLSAASIQSATWLLTGVIANVDLVAEVFDMHPILRADTTEIFLMFSKSNEQPLYEIL